MNGSSVIVGIQPVDTLARIIPAPDGIVDFFLLIKMSICAFTCILKCSIVAANVIYHRWIISRAEEDDRAGGSNKDSPRR